MFIMVVESLKKQITFYTEAKTYFESSDYKKGISAILNDLGKMHQNLGNYETAIDFFNQGLIIDEYFK